MENVVHDRPSTPSSVPIYPVYCGGGTWGSGKGGGKWEEEAAGEKLLTISEENGFLFWLTCTELDEPTL